MSFEKLYRFGSALIVMALATIVAGGLFALTGQRSAETAPESGAPTASESAKVARLVDAFPDSSGTSMFVVFTSDSKLTDAQLTTVNDNISTIYANETDATVAPPALVSEDGTTAAAIIPLVKTNVVADQQARYDAIDTAAKHGLSGVTVYLSGPEGFAIDIANVFAGADVTLLIVTASVVVLLLLITYRSPILWIIPLLVVGTADGLAGGMARKAAEMLGGHLDASTTGILSVLVFGAGTNYALLIISRYREELIKHERRSEAMAKAVRGTAPAILASGGTVLIVMAVLFFAHLDSSRALGLAGVVGIAVAMISGLAVLPVALVLWPRWIFWPLTPKFGVAPKRESLWSRSGKAIARRPVWFSIGSAALAIGLALPALGVQSGLTQNERFLDKPNAVKGIEVLTAKFDAFKGTPVTIMARDADVDAVTTYLADRGDLVEIVPPPMPAGVPLATAATAAGAAPTAIPPVATAPTYSTVKGTAGGWTYLTTTLDMQPETTDSRAAIASMRTDLDGIGTGDSLVGGNDAQILDTRDAISADEGLIFPSVLAVVFLVLMLVLRALVAPLLLLATVVASYFAAVGTSWLLFESIWGFPALDSNVWVLSFLFLVALGIDYNMFLMTRVKEESELFVDGKPAGIVRGMVAALGATGGVITSAGVLLAAVFAVLGVLPLITLTQIGVIVCVGVLLDTLLVRTVVVPSLTFMVGERMWWPRRARG
jgi:RND superfamily putative drug exporter